tara:strand:- start:456 stop:890 length:435 start_codon:yes stop_codon:yes gene_type:complete
MAIGIYGFTFIRKVHLNKELLSRESEEEYNKFNSNITHEAMCGIDLVKCSVNFENGKLKTTEGLVIKRTAFKGVIKSTECRQRFIFFPMLIGCFKSQHDRDFTLTYSLDNGLTRSTQISFRPGYLGRKNGWRDFQADIVAWTEN